MDIMKKIITALALTLLISTASAQDTFQLDNVSSTGNADKKDPIIIILCMPFPSCEENGA